MLTPLDENLLHQAPTTFDHAVTSDHRFFDRWAVGVQHEAASVIYGLAFYKNTDVCDGFFCLQTGDRQVNLRLSRPLRPQYSMRVGPLRIEVTEALRAHRIIVESHAASGLRADLTWTGDLPPREEQPHFQRRHGRAQMDYCRLDQLGTATGSVEIGDTRIELDDAFAWRDHSWGVRPGMGGVDPAGGRDVVGGGTAPGGSPSHLGSLFIWLAFRAGPFSGQFQCRQGRDGQFEYVDGHLIADTASPTDSLAVTAVRHNIRFVDGHTAFDRAQLEVLTADGRTWHLDAEPLRAPWVFMGAGYAGGWSDGGGLGVFRGEATEYDEYRMVGAADIRLPDGTTGQPWHRETDVRLLVNGVGGNGHLTIIARPPLPVPTLGQGE